MDREKAFQLFRYGGGIKVCIQEPQLIDVKWRERNMMIQMAGCLKKCKVCEHKEKCNLNGVCSGIYESKKGLDCSEYKRRKLCNKSKT